MMSKLNMFLIAAAVIVVVVWSSIFVVDEREKALVLQFGQIKAVKEEPGLAFKIPFIQDVVRYDDRILGLDTETIEVTPSDDRRLVVDAFARYRIADVVQFRQAVGVGGMRAAEDRLTSVLNAQIREVLGADQVTSDTILSEDRRLLMTRIRDQARTSASGLGLDVVDVRLKQTNLPAQNLEATYARMRAEREREAADEIARGNEAAQRVRALADRTVTETLSEADRDANIIRGEADARRNQVFAEAYGADQEFFAFYRSLQAYETALTGDNSRMVMTPDSEFFDYFKSDRPGSIASASAAETDSGAAPAQEPSSDDTSAQAPTSDDAASEDAPDAPDEAPAASAPAPTDDGETAAPATQ